MNRWFSSAIAVAVGACVGLAAGYGVALVKAGTTSVLLSGPAGNRFERVSKDMGKLNALEVLVSNCKGASDASSTFANEADVIRRLRETQPGSASAIIDVAEARLTIRTALTAETANDAKLQSGQEARAQKLLERAGWRDPSASRMRQIIMGMDKEQCQQPTTNGERNP